MLDKWAVNTVNVAKDLQHTNGGAKMSARLVGIQAKIDRARYHINDLETRISAFRDTEPYTLRCDYDPQHGSRTLRVVIRSCVPSEFAVIAGEAVHHLRSALDHLAWQLVVANGGTPGRNTYFPLDKTPPKDTHAFAKKAEGMSAAAIDLILSKQPYQPENELLGMLHEVDNFDKHRLLLVAAYGIRQLGFSYRNPILDQIPELRAIVERFTADNQPSSASRPSQLFLLRDGEEFSAQVSWPSGPPLSADEVSHLNYEIAFAQPDAVECQPVIPLLRQFLVAVESVISDFIPHL